MSQEIFGDIRRDANDDIFHIAVCCGVVFAQVAHDEACVHFVVEQAGEECVRFFWVDFSLTCPILVWLPDPTEIVFGEVVDCIVQLAEWWVGPSETEEVVVGEEPGNGDVERDSVERCFLGEGMVDVRFTERASAQLSGRG